MYEIRSLEYDYYHELLEAINEAYKEEKLEMIQIIEIDEINSETSIYQAHCLFKKKLYDNQNHSNTEMVNPNRCPYRDNGFCTK